MTLLLAFAGAAPQKERLPKKPDWPFTVFILANPSDEAQATEELSRGAEVLKKKIAGKKDWFQLVARMEDAEIVVEVDSHRVREHLTFWASTKTLGGETQGVTNSTISHFHSLRAKVTLLGGQTRLTGMDPKRTGSIKGAASALLKELVKHCQERYAVLKERRARPGSGALMPLHLVSSRRFSRAVSRSGSMAMALSNASAASPFRP